MQRTHTMTSVIGYLVLAVPASFVAVNVLRYVVGVDLPWDPWETLLDATEDSPARYALDLMIVFGPVIAFAAFFIPMLKVSFGGENEQLVTVVVRKTSRTKVIFVAASVGVLGILGTYLFFENLPCILGEQLSC